MGMMHRNRNREAQTAKTFLFKFLFLILVTLQPGHSQCNSESHCWEACMELQISSLHSLCDQVQRLSMATVTSVASSSWSSVLAANGHCLGSEMKAKFLTHMISPLEPSNTKLHQSRVYTPPPADRYPRVAKPSMCRRQNLSLAVLKAQE